MRCRTLPALALLFAAAPAAAAPPPSTSFRVQVGHSDFVTASAILPDGSGALTASKDGSVHLWNLRAGKDVATLRPGSEMPIWRMALSPDGRLVATGGRGPEVDVRQVRPGGEAVTLRAPGDEIKALAFSPDGRRLAVGTDRDGISVFDLQGESARSGRPTLSFRSPDSNHFRYEAASLAISPDGKLLAAGLLGLREGEVRLFALATGELVATLASPASTRAVDSLAFSPDGRRLLAASSLAEQMVLWDVASGRELKRLEVPREGEGVGAVAFLAGGAVLSASSNGTGLVRRWNLETGKAEVLPRVPASSLSLRRDGKVALSESTEHSLVLWDVAAGEVMEELESHGLRVESVDFSPDGKLLAAGVTGLGVVLWDLAAGRPRLDLPGSVAWPSGVRFTADAARVFHATRDGGIALFDLAAGRRLHAFPAGMVGRPCLSVARDGSRLATAGWDHMKEVASLRLFDAATGKERWASMDEKGPIAALAISPDGRRLVAATLSRLTIRDLEAGAVQQEIPGEWLTLDGLSPDGLSVRASRLNQPPVWVRLDSGALTPAAPLGKEPIDPDPQRTVCNVGRQNRELPRTLAGQALPSDEHAKGLENVARSPDGRWVASGGTDGAARVWDLSTGEWTALIGSMKRWLIFGSDGFWDASPDGGSLAVMVRGGEAWNLDQFAPRANRPDRLLARLPGARPEVIEGLRQLHARRLRRLGLPEGAPAAEMQVPSGRLETTAAGGKFAEVTATCRSAGAPLARVQLHANDVPLLGALGRTVSGQEATIRERVELVAGANKLELTCTDAAGADSYREQLSLRWEGEVEPDLYYLGLGVSAYQDPTITPLAYAAKDAADLGAAFQAMEGRRFRKVHARVLADAAVTRAAIVEAKKLLDGARVDDTFVLFIAGHGVQVVPGGLPGGLPQQGAPKGKGKDARRAAPAPTPASAAPGAPTPVPIYYFVTADAKLRDIPGTAVDFDSVEQLLQGIAPRNKLFLMDTCESGEADGVAPRLASVPGGRGLRMRALGAESRRGLSRLPSQGGRVPLDRDRYINNDLSRRSGAVVFSASAASEASLESDEWKQGAFTSRLLAALQDPKADANHDRILSSLELRRYVSAEVARLTGDLQHPTVDRDNLAARIALPAARSSGSLPPADSVAQGDPGDLAAEGPYRQPCELTWSGAVRGQTGCTLQVWEQAPGDLVLVFDLHHPQFSGGGRVPIPGSAPSRGPVPPPAQGWRERQVKVIRNSDPKRVLWATPAGAPPEAISVTLTAVGKPKPCSEGSTSVCWVVHGSLDTAVPPREEGGEAPVRIQLDF